MEASAPVLLCSLFGTKVREPDLHLSAHVRLVHTKAGTGFGKIKLEGQGQNLLDFSLHLETYRFCTPCLLAGLHSAGRHPVYCPFQKPLTRSKTCSRTCVVRLLLSSLPAHPFRLTL